MQSLYAAPAFGRSAPATAPAPARPALARHHDAFVHDGPAFDALVQASTSSGGLMSADELALRLRDHDSDQPLSRVARWIVAHDVLSLDWRGQTWLPSFQFEPARMSLRPGVSEIVHELADTFDDWELMTWFTSPNSSLHDLAPCDVIATRPVAVLDAARLDRFIARG